MNILKKCRLQDKNTGHFLLIKLKCQYVVVVIIIITLFFLFLLMTMYEERYLRGKKRMICLCPAETRTILRVQAAKVRARVESWYCERCAVSVRCDVFDVFSFAN